MSNASINELRYEPPGEVYNAAPSRLDIAVIGLRLLGIYLLVQGLNVLAYLPMLSGGLMSNAGVGPVWMLLLPYSFYGLMGIALLGWAEQWARWILPRQAAASECRPAGASDLQAMALAVVGVLLIASALPQIAGALAQARLQTEGESILGFALVQPGMQVLLGLLLFLRIRGVMAMWRRLQYRPPVLAHPAPPPPASGPVSDAVDSPPIR